ncbi:MAG: flagellar M-ring protein FliF C-terminal domain-containing protein [Phycisphaerales bacterium]|nr:flagellar M-ring protein FliF C-terminal domain-containing protein [Phycisphaerales bacterium]
MDQLRQALENIQQQVGKMTASQKLLLASLTVIAFMTLFLVSQYAAKPAVVDLMAVDGELSTVHALQGGGYDAQMVDGRVVIPQGQQASALAYLSESGQLPGDTTLLFSNLISSQDWKGSKAQHQQQYNIALQNELSRVLSNFRSVSKATVILDIPQSSGLGRAAKAATASVTLFGASSGGVSQSLVDAAAQLVAGAVSGLNPVNVQVIDGLTGRARSVANEESLASSRYLEYATQVEKYTKEKIESLFNHIPGVVVSITAQVDITRVESSEKLYMPTGEGSVSIVTSDKKVANSTSQTAEGAEAGVRSNQAVAINTGSGAGSSTEQETGETQFQVGMGQKMKSVSDPRGMPTHFSASVIIPQEYISSIIAQSRPVVEGEEPAPVTSDEARQFFDAEKIVFESLIQPHLVGVDGTGAVSQGSLMVSMAPLGSLTIMGGELQSAGFMGSLTGGSGGALGSSGKMIETALVGVLAVVSLAMMLMMVKRSSQKIELPDAQSLVGVPPHLESVGDLVGEASEGDHVMTGIEVDEQLLEVQHLRDQVAELINQDPESAAGLVERWADVEAG